MLQFWLDRNSQLAWRSPTQLLFFFTRSAERGIQGGTKLGQKEASRRSNLPEGFSDKYDLSLKYKSIGWVSEWIGCLTSQLTIFQLYMWRHTHRCAGGLKKKLDLRSGSQRHRHFVGFFNVPVLAPTRDHPFYTLGKKWCYMDPI